MVSRHFKKFMSWEIFIHLFMLLPSLVLFIPLCRCVFLFVIICLLPEGFPLTSLVVKVYWRWILTGFVYWKIIFILPLFLKYTFQIIEFWVDFFPPLVKGLAPLSSHLRCFWREISCHSFFCSSVYNASFFLSLLLRFYLGHLFWAFWLWCALLFSSWFFCAWGLLLKLFESRGLSFSSSLENFHALLRCLLTHILLAHSLICVSLWPHGL